MKRVLLLLAVVACVHGAPTGGPPPSSCKDPATIGVAGLALEKINLDRTKGYVLSLERLKNVQQSRHGETGAVYYLTMDVLETKCHVLSKKNWKDCENRDIGEHQVYGQCKAALYINKPQRVVRLYKYSCNLRPLSVSKLVEVCPDCPVMGALDSEDLLKTMKLGMEKFNKENMPANYFVPLELVRATVQGGLGIFRNVEFTIQETVCSNKTDVTEASKCEVMNCHFAHKGFCKASYSNVMGKENVNVKCEIYEPEAAELEKQLHDQGLEGDHVHKNNVSATVSHDHAHDHTVPHFHPPGDKHDHAPGHKHDHKHDHKGEHTHDSGHHHPQDHSERHGHGHDHDHTHDHGKSHGHDHHGHQGNHTHDHNHDHVHAHHSQAHNHTHDQSVHTHHNYKHTDGETHEHDHELALDHEHKHGHLHEHEHHHHHHQQHRGAKTIPEGSVRVHPALDKPTTLPFFPDPFEVPDRPIKIALRPDPEIPGATEPMIGRFPNAVSPNCPAEFKSTSKLILEAFATDPLLNTKPAPGKA